MKYPRVLVISNECLSQSNSNGRTLGNFFVDWPKDKLAQFCLGITDPDFSICNNFFSISDRDALRAVLYGGSNIGIHIKDKLPEKCASSRIPDKRICKTAYKMLLRHFVWSCNRWKNKTYNNWIDTFKPELVIIQSGDSAFMLQIAADVAKKKNIPLVFFNTEGYYFFKNIYMRQHWSDIFAFPLYQGLYKRIFRKVIKQSSHSIYGNFLLKEDYDREFAMPNSVVYTSSVLEFSPKLVDTENPKFSYLGNFGFDRPKALIEIAETLKEINPKYQLDIYGSARKDVVERFQQCPNINYHGFVNYDNVKNIMRESDVLFHAECQDEHWQEMLRYGFSTKIADCISSGSNFILYSSSDIACARYLQSNNAGWFVETRGELKKAIVQILNGTKKQKEYIQNAKTIAGKNHSMGKNRKSFQSVISAIVYGDK